MLNSINAPVLAATGRPLIGNGANGAPGTGANGGMPAVLNSINAPVLAATGRPLIGNGANGAPGTGANGGSAGRSQGRQAAPAGAQRGVLAGSSGAATLEILGSKWVCWPFARAASCPGRCSARSTSRE